MFPHIAYETVMQTAACPLRLTSEQSCLYLWKVNNLGFSTFEMEYINLQSNILITTLTTIYVSLVLWNLMVQQWFCTVSTGCNNKEKIYMKINSKITYGSVINQTG